LYGVPGSGKTSLIHAMAGELGLDIYVVSLSASWMSDNTLSTLMGRVPSRCIVLLEDLDAAFTHSVESRGEKKKKDKEKKAGPKTRREREKLGDQNSLSLGGLLNALDGVAAAEGRILFA
jgi:mitochondrial chaperone BCS1